MAGYEPAVLQPFRRIELIVHIAISVLPGTHSHLSQVKHLRVKCLAEGHNILTMSLRGDKHDISLKILHQAGFETARQAATSAERHALTIAPCPSRSSKRHPVLILEAQKTPCAKAGSSKRRLVQRHIPRKPKYPPPLRGDFGMKENGKNAWVVVGIISN